VTKCERRLSYTSAFLSQAGRLEVTNSIFTSFPMFCMSTFKLYKTMIKQVDIYRKHSLWIGADINDRSPSKAAWELVCLPKSGGGLEVLNLQTQNEALLLKNLHKFYNRLDIPWVNLIWERHYSSGALPNSSNRVGSFWWKDFLKLLDSFKGLAMVNVADGKSCLFWNDLWLNKVPRLHYPQLFSFAKNAGPSLHLVMNAGELEDFLHLPLSPLAVTQLLQVAEDLLTLPANDEKDTWTYIWGSPFFSTSRAYKHLTGHMPTHPFFRKIWMSSCQNKHKFFFWLLLKNRLSTREILTKEHASAILCLCLL